MALQLQPDQLLAALFRLEHPSAGTYLDQLLGLMDDMAADIVETIPNLEHSPAEFWDEIACSPIRGTGPIPEALKGFDDQGWE